MGKICGSYQNHREDLSGKLRDAVVSAAKPPKARRKGWAHG